MSTSVLKALPGKLDINRHSPSILYHFQLHNGTDDSGEKVQDNSMDLSDPKVENMDNETDPSMDIQETGEDKYRLSLQVFNICPKKIFSNKNLQYFLYPPQTLFVGGILFSRCPSVRASVRNALFP